MTMAKSCQSEEVNDAVSIMQMIHFALPTEWKLIGQ
jgi:hypothetical protein